MNIYQTINQLAQELHKPTQVIWAIAIKHNYVCAGMDLLVLLCCLGLIRFGFVAWKQSNAGVAFVLWAIGSLWFLFALGDIMERVITPQWSATQDIIDSVEGDR